MAYTKTFICIGRSTWFDVFGHTLMKYVDLRMKEISRDAATTWKNNVITSYFEDNGVYYVIRVTSNTLSSSAYVDGKLQSRVGPINEAIVRIAKRLRLKHGAIVEQFSDRTSRVANVSVPWGHFSGNIYSHIARWSLSK